MPVLITYRIIDGFHQYNDYHIHQDNEDMIDDEELIKEVFPDSILDENGGDQDDYRKIEVETIKHISVKQAEFLRDCHIAFPFGGNEWLQHLATKKGHK
tara:strand:+ start:429 stop:725 length:297 start_codon:yes stop_codon:yes gene_type:complete